MKNKKIIFLAATVCCLVVCWLCFGAWSIADTSYTSDSFNVSTTNAYVYVVCSPNITSSDFSNIGTNFIYYSSGSTSIETSNVALNSWNYFASGYFRIGFNTFASGRAVVSSLAISSRNNALGNYFISAAYVKIDDGDLVSVSNFNSNFVRYSFTSSSYRTLIVFLDKYSSDGVSQEVYDELLQRYEDLEYDFSDLESDYDDLYIEVQEYIALYNQELAINTALNTRIEELQARIDSLESGGSALDFIGSAFEKVGDILQIEILPNITIGTIVAVPLILGVVFLVLRLVRGE